MLGKNEIANAWDLTPAYLYVKFTTEFPPSAFSELAEKTAADNLLDTADREPL